MEDFEWKGDWWLPENPDIKVKGTLRFTQSEGAVLEVFEDNSQQLYRDLGKLGLICGITSSDDEITLYDCMKLRETIFVAEIVFQGHIFETVEAIDLDTTTINYSHFAEWFVSDGFEIENLPGERTPLKLSYTFPDEIEIPLEDFTIYIIRKLNQNHKQGEINLKETVYARIESKTPCHFNDFSPVSVALRNFLCLGTGQTVTVLSESGTSPEFNRDLRTGGSYDREIRIFFTSLGIDVPRQKATYGRMLFRYTDLSDNIEEYMKNWFAKSKQLEPVWDIYFGLFYVRHSFMDRQFLILSQSLEAYHRRTHGGEYMTEDEYESVKVILINAIPKELKKSHKESLKSRMTFGNELSFRTRLKRILSDVLHEQSELIDALIANRNEFINRIVATRNYLTHFGEEGVGVITDSDEKYAYVEKMKLLLQLCFLKELGLPSEKITKIMSRNAHFRHWANQ